MIRLRLGALAAAAFALSACADSGPATVRIFGLNPATGQYGFFDARLESLHDVTEMRGDTVVFRGNSTVVGDALVAVTDPKSSEVLRAEGGEAPACSFTVVDGVLHADDYDSLNMASSYWALEQSRKLFIDLGVPASDLNALNGYYHPRIQFFTKVIPTFWYMTDNAAYAPTFDGFLIVPHLLIQGAPPFSANLGVMAHEYSHKVFNRIIERGANMPAWQIHEWQMPAVNQFRGLDEGIADVFGYLATRDPNFIRPSMGDQADLFDRDLAKARVMTAQDVDDLLTNASYDTHLFGAFFAAAMWRFGEDLKDHRRVATSILEVEREVADAIAVTPNYDFSAMGFFDRLLAQFEGNERQALCGILRERFAELIKADTTHPLAGCP